MSLPNPTILNPASTQLAPKFTLRHGPLLCATSEYHTTHLISISELSQKYLQPHKREKGRLGKCEQNVQRPWADGSGLEKKAANLHLKY